jgi:spoIID/lytB domain-containing protein
LSDLLIKHKYMTQTSVYTNSSGYVVYNKAVQNGVRAFQKDAALTQDGIAGSATITKLQTWVPKVYNLGDRVLKKEMQGADVTQLKNILIDKGFLEKPFAKGEIRFDAAIETALKKFQNSVGIDATGTVDAQTLYFLKKQND